MPPSLNTKVRISICKTLFTPGNRLSERVGGFRSFGRGQSDEWSAFGGGDRVPFDIAYECGSGETANMSPNLQMNKLNYVVH